MRQPLEDGTVCIARAAMSLTFPARFMLAAAMNPCPCGFFNDRTPRMSLHAADDSALHVENFRTAARPHRHSHRRARGELQRNAQLRIRTGELSHNPRASDARPRVAAADDSWKLPNDQALLQRPNGPTPPIAHSANSPPIASACWSAPWRSKDSPPAPTTAS